MVALLTVVQIVSYLDRFLPSLILPDIKADLHLSDFQLGLLLGPAFAVFYVTVGLPFGWAADRFPRRAILIFGITVWSAMTTSACFAFSFLPLFICRLGVGFGEATVAPCSVSMISDAFPRAKRARPMGLFMAGTYLGAGSAFLFGGPLVHWIEGTAPLFSGMRPWQSVFLLAGLPGFVMALLMLSYAEPRRTERTQNTSATLIGALRFMAERWRAFGALFVGSGCIVTLSGLSLWNVALFQRSWGWKVGPVGIATGLMLLIAGPLGTVSGVALAQYWIARGRRDACLRAVIAGLAIAAPSYVIFPLLPTAALGLSVMFFGYLGQTIATAVGPSALTFLAPGQIRSQATALYYLAVSLMGQVLGPPVVGWMVDRFGSPQSLRYAISIEAAAVSIPALILLLLGLGAFRRRAEELESETDATAPALPGDWGISSTTDGSGR